jgi:hypothetical protein
VKLLTKTQDNTEIRKIHKEHCKAVKGLVYSGGGQQVPLQTADGIVTYLGRLTAMP